ncbi:DUF1120 domain-containing protein [Serratia fonticola]|uniref:DUF1120 domain-containing protein n=1 Tax=Serratia fonticola TaxID=47917 RepID=UPI0034C6446B
MKYKHFATAIPLLMLGTISAKAASLTTELKVGGELTSKSTCDVNVDGGGIFDLGRISASTVKDTDVPLPTSSMNVNITCAEKVQVTYQIIDNKEGTASTEGENNFGFGNINGTGKLGYYTLMAYSGNVDGRDSRFYSSEQIAGLAPNSLPLITIPKKKFVGWVDQGGYAAKGQVFRLSLMISPVLAPIGKMNGGLNEGTSLDGSATVNLFYGI